MPPTEGTFLDYFSFVLIFIDKNTKSNGFPWNCTFHFVESSSLNFLSKITIQWSSLILYLLLMNPLENEPLRRPAAKTRQMRLCTWLWGACCFGEFQRKRIIKYPGETRWFWRVSLNHRPLHSSVIMVYLFKMAFLFTATLTHTLRKRCFTCSTYQQLFSTMAHKGHAAN